MYSWLRQICANSEENNADECYWDDPTSYGFEGKCTICCSGDNCNDDLPTNLLPQVQNDGRDLFCPVHFFPAWYLGLCSKIVSSAVVAEWLRVLISKLCLTIASNHRCV